MCGPVHGAGGERKQLHMVSMQLLEMNSQLSSTVHRGPSAVSAEQQALHHRQSDNCKHSQYGGIF